MLVAGREEQRHVHHAGRRFRRALPWEAACVQSSLFSYVYGGIVLKPGPNGYEQSLIFTQYASLWTPHTP